MNNKNTMQKPYISKVILHMGVGEAGERLVNAENIMSSLTQGSKPIRSYAKNTLPAFGIRRGQPIGCKVTLRGEKALSFLSTALKAYTVENSLYTRQFDTSGNFAFGIEEHTDFPNQAYDPKIGIYGMDILVVIERKGTRIARRKIQQRKINSTLHVSREESIAFVSEAFGIEVKKQ
ncbi:MAG TPA: 50S ribosomal protein L5 [Methanocorpusculum sp.]|nr:50S ribosomal protein L5 [Methanocorpusculum sp.]